MTNTTDPLLKSVQDEIQLLEQRLAQLRPIERQLRANGGGPVPNFSVRPHTPAGELRKAILAALKGIGPITSAQLKVRIRNRGYPHPMNSQYFTKTLRALVAQKVVSKFPKGSFSTYEIR